MTPQLQATLAKLPTKPGVYLLKDKTGRVLYVGKAQSLRNRVRQYWQAGRGSQAPLRIESAIDRVADVEYTMVDSVSEALLLEATLIKRHQPRFNVRLKDDKSYPYIKVTLGDDFPRIERTRKLPNDGSRYFGPYASASSVDEAMNLIRRLFPFRTCTIPITEGKRALPRPCLLYHIKRCQGPCIEAIGKDAYRADIDQVMLFLEGRQDQVAKRLRAEMNRASATTDYERAADMRDKLRAIERTMESQKMAAFARTELDVLGYARQGGGAAVQLFAIRNGTTVARDIFLLENVGDAPNEEALSAFIKQYYAAASSIPPRVLVPWTLPDSAELVAYLEARRGHRVALDVPQRGERRALMQLAERNAAETLNREQARWLADQGKTLAALEELAGALGLPTPPLRIECYDISTIQGTNTVGSMVVFEEGRPRSGEYRRFRVRTTAVSVGRPDDYASHREVLRRRFYRALEAEEGAAEELRWRLPDLVVIDGGLGQANVARGVLDELGLHDLPVVGLAKEREEIFLPNLSTPLVLPTNSQALYLVQRLRDEAHRFAIAYHRKLRAKSQIKSALDDVAGVGPARKRALLRVFGSTRQMRSATIDEIASVPGISRALAETIRSALNG
ncbi:MAG: excinuclease subunit [Chloroflexota bacterium]|jgi:excinuclease ABC subunit C|nr:excinuclease subunit [Chloroflexota bacterium]